MKTRIAAIALIPVLGLLANGLAYFAGQREVQSAFDSVRSAAAASDAARELKVALMTMRSSAGDLVLQPGLDKVGAFSAAHLGALSSLAMIEAVDTGSHRSQVAAMREQVSRLKATFDDLHRGQEALGFGDNDGIRGKMAEAARNIERLTNQDNSWLSDNDRWRLLSSILAMRRYEADYRLAQHEFLRQKFFEEHANFNAALEQIAGSPQPKDDLARHVRLYAETFGQWVAASGRVGPPLALIRLETQRLLPIADGVMAAAHQRQDRAAQALTASREWTTSITIGVGLATVLAGLALSWWIARGLTRPLRGLSRAMTELAAGDKSVHIPAVDRRDEIGDMARTLLVFRDHAAEREELATAQCRASEERERRSAFIASTIEGFERSVSSALEKVREASHRLDEAAIAVNGAADSVSAEARSAEKRVEYASENVSAAASSAEELAASIGQIAMQASKSTEVAGRAVAETKRTVGTMGQLAAAATRIGEVIGLIQSIAGQTNLLALNATIEAARAGEAGRGFAVVASEVKTLAGQTARATEEIATHIRSIQSAADDAAHAIEQVNFIIEDMSGLAASVAVAVEEQNAAVSNIAEGVSRASEEARSGADAMTRVASRSQDARVTASDVKALAGTLAAEAERLQSEVRRFLADVTAA